MPASDAVPNAAAVLTLSSGSWMRVTHMLAEKFILALETLIRSRTHPDGSPRVASTSPHVPVKVGGLAVGVAQLSLHARRRGEPLEEERLSYLSLQRHAAVEYGEVRSVVAQT